MDLRNLFGVRLPSDVDVLRFSRRVDLTADPQRVQFAAQVWERIRSREKQRDIAAELGITQTAAVTVTPGVVSAATSTVSAAPASIVAAGALAAPSRLPFPTPASTWR